MPRPSRIIKKPARYEEKDETVSATPRRSSRASSTTTSMTTGSANAASRGRGRGRGRGRSRTTTAGRQVTKGKAPRKQGTQQSAKPTSSAATKKKIAFSDEDIQMMRENAEEREQHIDDLVNGLTEDQVKEYVKKLAKEQPGVVLDLMALNQLPAGPPEPDQPPAAPIQPQQPNWCVCGNCRLMHTPTEEECCGNQPDQCLSRTPEMYHLCLEPYTLRLSMLYRADVLAITNIGLDNEREKNRSYRYSGYRQHTLWQHGRLGRGVRRVIPSCCIWKIRDTFPDPSGQYVPFRYADF